MNSLWLTCCCQYFNSQKYISSSFEKLDDLELLVVPVCVTTFWNQTTGCLGVRAQVYNPLPDPFKHWCLRLSAFIIYLLCGMKTKRAKCQKFSIYLLYLSNFIETCFTYKIHHFIHLILIWLMDLLNYFFMDICKILLFKKVNLTFFQRLYLSFSFFFHELNESFNSIVLYCFTIFRSFTHMISCNPIVTLFSLPLYCPLPSPLVTSSLFSISMRLLIFCFYSLVRFPLVSNW